MNFQKNRKCTQKANTAKKRKKLENPSKSDAEYEITKFPTRTETNNTVAVDDVDVDVDVPLCRFRFR